MNINVGKYSKLTFTSITVTHTGEPELNFDGGGYRTARMVQRTHGTDDEIDNGLFKEVNDFIDKLSQEKQAALYNCYATAESLFQNYDESSLSGDASSANIQNYTLEDDLKALVKQIYTIITFEDLHDYVKFNRELKIPPELSDEYLTDDKITPLYVDRTYKLSEYIDLMALCLGLRFMIPLWGPYLKISAASEGMAMKEYHSFSILRGSALHMSRAYERMDVYVRANLDTKDLNMAPVLHFLSEEEIPTYAIAHTVIRKMSIAPLSWESDKHHLMKILYSYATNKIKGLGMNLEPGVQDKTDRGFFEDDNSSVFCLFKMKEQLSAGELEVFKVYIENYVRAGKSVASDIDERKIELCVTNTLKLKNWRGTEIQKGLVAWTLSPVITGSIIPLLQRRYLLIAMGITQAVLWHWGLHELAMLVTARVDNPDPNAFNPTGGKAKLSQTTLTRLDEVYQHEFPLRKHVEGGWSHNTGVRGIELFHKHLSVEDWIVQCPKALVKEYDAIKQDDVAVTGLLEPSPDLRESLAELLFKLHDHGLN